MDGARDLRADPVHGFQVFEAGDGQGVDRREARSQKLGHMRAHAADGKSDKKPGEWAILRGGDGGEQIVGGALPEAG